MVVFMGPAIDRDQHYFLRETLEESIPPDHAVRVFDFVLDQHDWGAWRAEYAGGGRPAYPPDVMCKLLVYGYSIGIRSSRALEHACRNSLDFIWLMSGRTPDHDTIAAFRREHRRAFKEVFRTTVAVCVEAGMVSMAHLAVDGTRVGANSGRGQNKTAGQIEVLLREVEARIEKVVAEAEARDREEDTLLGREGSPHDLPKELKDLRKQQARLRQALEKVQAKAERARVVEGLSAEEASRKRVPLTDPDADVMRNKEGGFGPNYTPYAGVDSQSTVIVSEGVTNSHHDGDHLVAAIEEAEATTGQGVDQVQADSDYATPENLRYCESAGIDPCIAPVNTRLGSGGRPSTVPAWPEGVPRTAPHADGSTVEGMAIPRDGEGTFAKSAFRYDGQRDCYVCPLGQELTRQGEGSRDRRKGTTVRVYRCSCGERCAFSGVCTRDRKGRSVKRREEEEVHERHAQRMKDPGHREDYRLRRQTVEPVFGTLKEGRGIRRFLLRGLEGVRAEWSLACCAFNLKKLAACVAGVGLLGRAIGIGG